MKKTGMSFLGFLNKSFRRCRNNTISYPFVKNGFSLIELLIAIIIISLITAAFVPVITKKITLSSLGVAGSGDGSGGTNPINPSANYKVADFDPARDCTSDFTTTDTEIQNSRQCTYKVPAGVTSINALIQSAGGGGAGANIYAPSSSYGQSLTTSGTKSILIDINTKYVEITYITGGGGGGGQAAFTQVGGGAPTSQSDCDNIASNLLFIPSSKNAGKAVCATKANVGDSYANGPDLDKIKSEAGITVVNAGTVCGSANDYTTKCCWLGNNIGTTSNGCSASVNGNSTYSGCKRTVCTWAAAKAACTAYEPDGSGTKGKWRLPTQSELSAWGSNLSTIQTNKGKNGLELCDNYSGYGSVQCYGYDGACPGSYNGYCNPYIVWSSDEYSSSNAYYHYLNSGSFNSFNYYKTYAFSARCVLESGGLVFNPYSAASGGSASFATGVQIPREILETNVGGSIVIKSGTGGSGGAAASISSGVSGANGSAGGLSSITVEKDGVIKWGFRVKGGYGGHGGNVGSNTLPSDMTNNCEKYNTTQGTWQAYSGSECFSGLSGYDVANQGQAGGKVPTYDTSSHSLNKNESGALIYSSGAKGGTTSSQNGSSASIYGGGGGAGLAVASGKIGSGGSGKNGFAEIRIKKYYPAAAGGGGGGGGYAILKDIAVIPGSNVTIYIGKGGKGGSGAVISDSSTTEASSGTNGGASKIVTSTLDYKISGGKGGSVGTPATISKPTTISHGSGGNGATVSVSYTGLVFQYVSNGDNGSRGKNQSEDELEKAIGGNGGKAGNETPARCGGFNTVTSLIFCTEANAGTVPVYTELEEADILSENGAAASSGSGGGGGGWNNSDLGGNGSDGMDGFVYIYLKK